ncbi:hypothetical protein GCM10009682_18170 [Luedemannella flava]|uniref:Uncharacterized protein n=1 Tax=Luedemannella flava TaxID=349316 RepID=A0ABN2LQR9_9ACTN
MNVVKPRAIAGVVGALSTAALGAGVAAPAIAAAVASSATIIDTPAVEAGPGADALSVQAPEDVTTAKPAFGEVCFPGA